MSFRKKNKSYLNLPSSSKIEQMKLRFPEIEEDICESVLTNFNWNLERSIRYLEDQEKPPSPAMADETSLEWPALTPSPVPFEISSINIQPNTNTNGISHTNEVPPGYSRLFSHSSGALKENVSPLGLFGERLIENRSKTQSSNAPVPMVAPRLSLKKDHDIIWQPVKSSRNPRKKVDREAMQQALKEEMKYETSERIFRLISSKNGANVLKILVLLRGVPGSGKSTLADLIAGVSENGVICSADDHFVNQFGHYVFNAKELSAAHAKCQGNCMKAMKASVSPVVIDNTNTQSREMLPYVELAAKFGYTVEILEPNTPWKRNAQMLSKKNTHEVPKASIRKMLDRWEFNVTPDSLIAQVSKNRQNENQFFRSTNPVQKLKVSASERPMTTFDRYRQPLSPDVSYGKTAPGSNVFVPSQALCSPTVEMNKKASPNYQSPTLASSSCSLPTQEIQFREDNYSIKDYCVASNEDCAPSTHVNEPTVFLQGGKTKNKRGLNSSLDLETALEDFESDSEKKKTSANMLQNLFPSVPTDYLDDLFTQCDGDVNWCSDILVEGGYVMSGSCEGPRRSELFLSGKRSSSDNAVRRSKSEELSLDKRNGIEKDYCGNLNFHSVPPGFTQQRRGSDCSSLNRERRVSEIEPNSPNEQVGELFEPTDGDDWFDINLDPMFVHQVADIYSDLASLDPSALPKDVLKIRVPPKLGFELFKLFANNWLQQSVNPYANRDSNDDKDDGEIANENDSACDELISQLLQEDYVEEFKLLSLSHQPATSHDPPSLREIMASEAKREQREQQDTRKHLAQIKPTLADKLKLDKLVSGFPSVARSEITLVYAKAGCVFDEALGILKANHPSKFVGISEVMTVMSDKNNKRIPESDQPPMRDFQQIPQGQIWYSNPTPVYFSQQVEKNLTADDWRMVAVKYHLLRIEVKQRMAKEGGRNGGADYYIQLEKYYQGRMIFANEQAADIICEHAKLTANTLDLHHLYVVEATKVLDKFLRERSAYVERKAIRRLYVAVIPGQGRNSKGAPRLPPAVKEYLKKRHLAFFEASSKGMIIVILRYMETRWTNNFPAL